MYCLFSFILSNNYGRVDVRKIPLWLLRSFFRFLITVFSSSSLILSVMEFMALSVHFLK